LKCNSLFSFFASTRKDQGSGDRKNERRGKAFPFSFTRSAQSHGEYRESERKKRVDGRRRRGPRWKLRKTNNNVCPPGKKKKRGNSSGKTLFLFYFRDFNLAGEKGNSSFLVLLLEGGGGKRKGKECTPSSTSTTPSQRRRPQAKDHRDRRHRGGKKEGGTRHGFVGWNKVLTRGRAGGEEKRESMAR